MKSIDVNRIKIIIALFLYLLFVNHKSFSQDLVINEIMSLNESTIMDKFGDYPDWIELYNNSNYSINLHNYCVSDDAEELDKWKFPEVTISANSYLLIFASGKNILDTTELHSNFKISSAGENLFLSNSDCNIIYQIDPVTLMEDETFGSIPDGSDFKMKLSNPSPGSSNLLNNQLAISHTGGFYKSPFCITIKSFSDDTIYYTLDGTIPTTNSNIIEDSLFLDYKYLLPNIISEIPTTPDQSMMSYKAWESPANIVDKATILRYVSCKNGKWTSKVYTHSFFIDSTIFEKYQMPIMSLVTEDNNFFSNDSGIYVPGVHFDINNPEWSGNYFKSGRTWERPVYIEYFENNGNLGFSQDAGIRIHGGKSRGAAQKSLSLFARSEYEKKYFRYPLFPDNDKDKFKRFLLRTTMGDWDVQTIIKDVLAHDIVKELGLEYQNYQPVIVYLNGEYWGIHTIRNRIDKWYIANTFDIDEDSVDIIGGNVDHVEAGSNSHYINLIEFIEKNDLSSEYNYEYIKTQIDIGNYITYMISELFFANIDWLSNNVKLWRPQTPDGKWRWFFYDLDAGFGDYTYNMFVHATMNDDQIVWPNPPASTFLFRNLLKNDRFVDQFINRYAEILNQDFNPDTLENKLFSIKELYKNEITHHISRWGYPENEIQWEEEIENVLLRFLQKRPCYVEYNLVSFFNLKEFGFTCEMSDVEQNERLVIAPNPSDGIFFIYNNSKSALNGTISISDVTGKIVYTENDASLERNEKKYIDLSEIPSNTYILNFYNTSFSERKKIVIVK